MNQALRRAAALFGAGAFGAAAATAMFWLCSRADLLALAGIGLRPQGAAWWSGQLVLGGLGGFLFWLPYVKGSAAQRGLVYSLVPTAVDLVYRYPAVLGIGFLGVEKGLLVPFFTAFYYAIWGVVAASLSQGGGGGRGGK